MTPFKVIFILPLLLFSLVTHAMDMSGIYQEAGTDKLWSISQVDDNQFKIIGPSWYGIGYWDNNQNAYEGVFRYKDMANSPYGKGDKHANAVWYHRITQIKANQFTVKMSWTIGTTKSHSFNITKLVDE